MCKSRARCHPLLLIASADERSCHVTINTIVILSICNLNVFRVPSFGFGYLICSGALYLDSNSPELWFLRIEILLLHGVYFEVYVHKGHHLVGD